MLNLPNTITVARIAAIPALVAAAEFGMFKPGWGLPLMFAIISTSDFVDGVLARNLNQITELGKLLDPVADKILVLAGLLILLELPQPEEYQHLLVPGWSVLVIMAREFAVSALRSIAATRGTVLAASPMGKIKTGATMFAIGFLFFRGPEPFTGLPIYQIGYALYWFSLVITLVSGAEYFWRNRQLLLEVQE